MWLTRRQLSPEEIIEEFDQWVTPTLGSVRDTAKFQQELEALQIVVEGVASVVMEDDATHMEALRAELMHELREPDGALASARLGAVLNTMFLVTAKSDNAVKCQYPLDFRRRNGDDYPRIVRGRLTRARIPDVVKAVDLVALAVKVRSFDWDAALQLLEDYVGFLLSDETDLRQLMAMVEAYSYADSLPNATGRDLLAPLVAFQVRGSVAASGGHDPEGIVRRFLESWGLVPGTHFNLSDATAAALNNWLVASGESHDDREIVDATADKTRAFDFILPFQACNSRRRILIQSQFYAGDSGSVSHKNVDQASKARAHAATLFPDARFVELVDGAGYCASLRKDLKHLLFAPDTDDFVQLRSIPVRLRRMLQESGVVAPLDLALLVTRGLTDRAALEADLRVHGVEQPASWIDHAVSCDWLVPDGTEGFSVHATKERIVARYGLLDTIIDASASVSSTGDHLLVPGFGPSFGAQVRSDWEGEALDSLLADGSVEHRSF